MHPLRSQSNRTPTFALPLSLLMGLLGWMTAPSPVQAAASAAAPPKLRPADLFATTNIWTVQLRFLPDQWTAMEPKTAPGAAGGLLGLLTSLGNRGAGGNVTAPRGAAGVGVATPAAGGIGTLVAFGFMSAGDANRDSKLSKAEFDELGATWFSKWDTNQTGALQRNQLNAGLNGIFANLFNPGGGAGGRGGGLFSLQGTEGNRNGLASAVGLEFNYVHAELDFGNQSFKDVAIRYKGNGTYLEARGSLKRPLKIDLNDYVKGQKLAGLTKLNLHNNVADASWMNEVLSFRLFRDAGVPAPRTSYAKVYVTVPALFDRQYFGLYSVVEDVDDDFLNDHFKTKDGTLFKPSTPALFADLGDDWAKYKQAFDPKEEVSEKASRRVIDFAKLLARADDTEFAAKVGEFLNLDEFARFMAVTVSLSALDSILAVGQNYYLYLDSKNEQFQFIPWDQDHSFGQLFGTQDQRENLSIHRPWQGENRFLERVFKVDAFKQLYLARLGELARNQFTPARLAKQVDEIAAAIRPAVQEESSDKLARFDTVVKGQPVAAAGLGGASMAGAKPIKSFVTVRSQSLLDQLAGRSEGQTIGGNVFGGGGGNPGNAPGNPGNQTAPANTGLGALLSPLFLTSLDANKDGSIARNEFVEGFGRWFASWNGDQSGSLTLEQLSAGLNRELAPITAPRGIGVPGQ